MSKSPPTDNSISFLQSTLLLRRRLLLQPLLLLRPLILRGVPILSLPAFILYRFLNICFTILALILCCVCVWLSVVGPLLQSLTK